MDHLFLQVMACVPLHSLCWDGIDLNEQLQYDLLNKVFRNEIVQRYPLCLKYLLSFLKTFLIKAEAQNHEMIDELYEVLGTLVSTTTSELGEYSHRSFYLGSNYGYITIKESVNLISSGTTGLRTWEAAFRMAEWVMDNKHVFSKKRVVEIGSGCGLLGLIISRITHPSSYTFTDHHDEVLDNLRENLHINCKKGRQDSMACDVPVITKLNWFSPNSFIESVPFDVMIGSGTCLLSDVVFDKDLSVALVAMLNTMLYNNPDSVIFIACTVRNKDTYTHFTDTLVNSSLLYDMIDTTDLPMYEGFYYDRTLPINILKIHHKL